MYLVSWQSAEGSKRQLCYAECHSSCPAISVKAPQETHFLVNMKYETRALWWQIPPPMPSAPDPLYFGFLNQKWLEIRIWISGSIQIWESAGSLPNCSVRSAVGVVISLRFVNSGKWLSEKC